MVQVIHRITTLGLAVMVLLSTTSFTINKHYCGKILIDVAINNTAKKCAMELYLEKAQSTITKPSCCKDEHQVVIGQDELKKNVELELNHPNTITSQTYVRLPQPLFLFDYQVLFSGNHDPPEIVSNFQQLYETYLI